MTKGFFNEIPDDVKFFLASVISTMAAKDDKEVDYLQVFTLKKHDFGGIMFQNVVHSQEVPPFEESIFFPCPDAVEQKVYVIDDGEYYTYLLAEEY